MVKFRSFFEDVELKAKDLVSALSKKLGTSSQQGLAGALGVSVQTLVNWKNRDKDLTPTQVAGALAKSMKAAVKESQSQTIRPIVEFYELDHCETQQGSSWQIFNGGTSATTYARGLRAALEASHGIYVFYDSRGHALYVGKARKQSLWKEMNLAFNRKRQVQMITLVKHPARNQTFVTANERLRQPKARQRELFDMAAYFSAYEIDDGMIDSLEALMVRGFANDLLNVRMETFNGAAG